MSSTETNDRFLRAASVDGNDRGVSKSLSLRDAQTYQDAIALDRTLLCRNRESLGTRFDCLVTSGATPPPQHQQSETDSKPIAYGPA